MEEEEVYADKIDGKEGKIWASSSVNQEKVLILEFTGV